MNIQIIRQLFAFIVCMLFLAACNDDPFAEEGSSSPTSSENVVCISGKETEVRLPVEVANIAHIEVSEDFAMPLTDSLYLRLYMEENDEEAARTVELSLTLNDGSRQTLYYSQGTRADEGESLMVDFSRTYGVGFSYDAIHGDYANLHDIKCQILNLKQLRNLEKEKDERLLTIDYTNESSESVESSRSFAEYIQNTVIRVSADADLVLFKGKYAKEMSIAEQGFRNSIYTKASLRQTVAKTKLEYPSLKTLLKKDPNSPVLTRSFRNAIKRLEQNHTIEEVDAFIEKFGSFIIIYSELGGELELVYKTNYDKFRSYQQEKELSSLNVLSFFNSNSDSQLSQDDLKILTTSKCALSVKGGDSSLLNEAVLNPSFDNPRINVDQYYDWINSLYYDDLTPLKNNVEMTKMEVAPIWDLINNPAVAKIIQARIEGTAQDMTEVFGYFNFANTSFCIVNPTVRCKLGGRYDIFVNPSMVNIIANNRYVAAVCYEWVPEISTDFPVYVAYPIYEQQLELTSGLCLFQVGYPLTNLPYFIAYKVAFKYGKFYVEKIGEVSNPTVYMENGFLSPVQHLSSEDYTSSASVIGYEWPGSILPNGTLNPSSQYYTTFKVFDKFYLDLPETYLNALPNWSFSNSVPNWPKDKTDFIKDKGDQFFDKLHVKHVKGRNIDNLKKRMIRNDDYRYYWNKLEIQPE